jgi:sulfur-oxidizing protein SoxZ
MAAARTLIQLPREARRGEVVELRVTIAHAMETGYRIGADGRTVPRSLVRRFSCHYGGAQVFAAELHPAVAANPFLAFTLRAEAGGPVTLRWEGDHGFEHTEVVTLAVA